ESGCRPARVGVLKVGPGSSVGTMPVRPFRPGPQGGTTMRDRTSAWIAGAALGAILMMFAPALLALPAYAASGWTSKLVGNPADVVTPTTGLWVAQGGGTDVDENFRRMGAAAGGGDFVVIRFGGTDAYNDYILSLCSCDSVETIIFKN